MQNRIFEKQEILISFLLAVLVTGLTWWLTPYATGPHPFRRSPLPYYGSWAISGYGHSAPEMVWPFVIFDFFFWFLVLATGWWSIERLNVRNGR